MRICSLSLTALIPDFAPPVTAPTSIASRLDRASSVMASMTAPTAAPVAAPLAILFPVDISSEKIEHSSRSISYCDIFTPFVSIIGFEPSNIELELLATHPDRVIRNSAVNKFFIIGIPSSKYF
ncbi:uncharacterized protein METZ01_LOCUS334267 [marine metagenome]|uniref:Uncharacterized protein n=1 Tax=marine metagenome TaxID=408172 RepID=A0A382Q765_9ZZZZ